MAENQNTTKPKPPQKHWRAKVDCTYKGRRVKKGETVFAEKMENTNFEADKEEGK